MDTLIAHGYLVLKLMLTGLVRCGHCNASMQPMSSGAPSKKGKRYTYYRCPRQRDGACPNEQTVREDALRYAVLATLQNRLFPMDAQQTRQPAWLTTLFEQVRAELQKLSEQAPDRRDGLRHQIEQVEAQMKGWVQSLGNPELPGALRQDLAVEYTAANDRRSALEQELRDLEHRRQATEEMLDVTAVLERVKRLDQVLAGSNPTLANLELSRHIDCINVHADGRVVLRACRLGVLAGAQRFLANKETPEAERAAMPAVSKVIVRARQKLCLDNSDFENPADDLMTYAGVHRFDGLANSWFSEEVLEIPKTSCWSETHAAEVAALWMLDPKQWTLPKLAAHFAVSIPTARKALKAGQKAAGIILQPRKLAPRGVQNYRLIADEAARLYIHENPPWTIRRIARQFGVNQITVSKALDHWYAQHGVNRPDGRNARKGRLNPMSDSVQPRPANDTGEAPSSAA